ncbi:MAG: hypothetical protein LC731_03765 [Acidobacteria bacterium]|nr:hypothetical protein [Acidobacteriota bacterium]
MYRNDKIRGKQAEKGWSNDHLANEAGVNIGTVKAIRQGKPVRTKSLEKVAEALELPMPEVYAPREVERALQ